MCTSVKRAQVEAVKEAQYYQQEPREDHYAVLCYRRGDVEENY